MQKLALPRLRLLRQNLLPRTRMMQKSRALFKLLLVSRKKWIFLRGTLMFEPFIFYDMHFSYDYCYRSCSRLTCWIITASVDATFLSPGLIAFGKSFNVRDFLRLFVPCPEFWQVGLTIRSKSSVSRIHISPCSFLPKSWNGKRITLKAFLRKSLGLPGRKS